MWPDRFVLVEDIETQYDNWKEAINNLEWLENLLSYKNTTETSGKLNSKTFMIGKKSVNDTEFKQFWELGPVKNDPNGTCEKLQRLINFINKIPPNSKTEIIDIFVEEKDDFKTAINIVKKSGSSILWLDYFLDEGHNEKSTLSTYISQQFREISPIINGTYIDALRGDKFAYGGNVLTYYYKAKTDDPVRVLVPASLKPNLSWLKKNYGDAITQNASLAGGFRYVFFSIFIGLDRWIKLNMINVLDLFWEKTNDWFTDNPGYPHIYKNEDNWKETLQATMLKYIGSVDNWFKDDTSTLLVHEMLKSVAGRNETKFCRGLQPLSVYGAYLIFLMGAYNILKSKNDTEKLGFAKSIDWGKSDKNSVRNANLFANDTSILSSEHKESAKRLFKIGELFALHDDPDKGCPILPPTCWNKSVTINLKLGNKDALELFQKLNEYVPPNANVDPKLDTSVCPNLYQLSKSKVLGGHKGGNIVVEYLNENDGIICIHLKPADHTLLDLGDFKT